MRKRFFIILCSVMFIFCLSGCIPMDAYMNESTTESIIATTEEDKYPGFVELTTAPPKIVETSETTILEELTTEPTETSADETTTREITTTIPETTEEITTTVAETTTVPETTTTVVTTTTPKVTTTVETTTTPKVTTTVATTTPKVTTTVATTTTPKATTTQKVTTTAKPVQQQSRKTYVLNTNTMRIHYPECKSVKKIKPENYATTNDYNKAVSEGYKPCGNCDPV